MIISATGEYIGIIRIKPRKTAIFSTSFQGGSIKITLTNYVENHQTHLGNLHPKKREDHSPASRSTRDQTIECDIQPTDTLLSLTLKYNIPLAELKRVNNILQESEFYALKRIKIPVKPASFLKDLIPGVHSEDSRRENGWFVDTKDTPNSFSSNMSSAISTGYSSPCSETEPSDRVFHESKDKKKVRKFLKEFDRDLERIKEKQLIRQEMVEDLQSVPELDTSREEIIFTNIPDSSQHSGKGYHIIIIINIIIGL